MVPYELFVLIFNNLLLRDVVRCSRVCKDFKLVVLRYVHENPLHLKLVNMSKIFLDLKNTLLEFETSNIARKSENVLYQVELLTHQCLTSSKELNESGQWLLKTDMNTAMENLKIWIYEIYPNSIKELLEKQVIEYAGKMFNMKDVDTRAKYSRLINSSVNHKITKAILDDKALYLEKAIQNARSLKPKEYTVEELNMLWEKCIETLYPNIQSVIRAAIELLERYKSNYMKIIIESIIEDFPSLRPFFDNIKHECKRKHEQSVDIVCRPRIRFFRR
jgi:hypothetical protein